MGEYEAAVGQFFFFVNFILYLELNRIHSIFPISCLRKFHAISCKFQAYAWAYGFDNNYYGADVMFDHIHESL